MSESQPFRQSPCNDEPFGCDSFMSDERYHVSDGPVSSVTQNANLYDISGMATWSVPKLKKKFQFTVDLRIITLIQ